MCESLGGNHLRLIHKEILPLVDKKYATLVKRYPALRLYVGITCRTPKQRIGEHKRSGKDFDAYTIEVEVPNLYSLADVEYWTLVYLSSMIPTVHIMNKAAGGDYFLPDMARAGVLYILLHFNSIQPGDCSPYHDFHTRLSPRFRHYPVLTNISHLQLPKFNKKTSLHKIFTLLGYKLQITKEERAQQRTFGIRCKFENCAYYAETEVALASHIYKNHKGLKFPCHVCDMILSTRARLRDHLRVIHKEILPLVDKKKPLKKTYPCTFKGCSEIFTSRKDMHAHWVKHRDYIHKCQDCPRSFHRSVDLRYHMKASHAKVLPFERDIKPETEHKCIICIEDRYFASQMSLRTHYERVHKMKKVEATLRKMREESKKE